GERLHHLFEQCCDRMEPNRLAVITDDAALTFRELDGRANQAARYLLGQGLKAGDRVALLFDKSIHGYVALLAVVKIGAAYVPLDCSFPSERIDFILEDAGVKAIISVSRFSEKLATQSTPHILLDCAERQIGDEDNARLAAPERRAAEDEL